MFSTTREEIAAALSGIDGVTGYARPPSVIRPGDSWPLLVRAEPYGPGGGVWSAIWGIRVILGGSEAEAFDRIDALLPAAGAALAAVVAVTSAEPAVIETSGGALFGVVITAISE